MSVYCAFYKGKGGLSDRAIRLRTFSKYSHCEMVVSEEPLSPLGFTGKVDVLAYTSSLRDGGVVKRPLTLKSENWDLLPVSWVTPVEVEEYYQITKGKKYDLLGVLVGQALKIKTHSKDNYFCSEWCSSVCRFNEPWRFSPGLQYLTIETINRLI